MTVSPPRGRHHHHHNNGKDNVWKLSLDRIDVWKYENKTIAANIRAYERSDSTQSADS